MIWSLITDTVISRSLCVDCGQIVFVLQRELQCLVYRTIDCLNLSYLTCRIVILEEFRIKLCVQTDRAIARVYDFR